MTKTNIFLGLIIGVIFATTLLFFSLSQQKAFASPATVTFETTATATTTQSFMTPGTATSTFQFDSAVALSGKVATMQAVDSGSMFIQFTASTSVSALAYQFQYSNNGIDWYGESASFGTIGGINNTQFEASSTVTHYWNPGGSVASTTQKAVSVPILPAQHERVVFSIPIGTNNGSVYAEFNFKRNANTP